VVSVAWFAASKVLVVAGKGGVGKSTVGASVAVAAARGGADVLVVELEGHGGLAPLLGADRLSYDDTPIDVPGRGATGRIRGRRIQPDDALADYLDRAGLGPLASRLTRSGAIEVVATAAPGIRDLLTLGKIRQLEQGGDADLIVVDAPATGHALTFLTAAAGLAASTSSGPVRDQADLVLEMFADDRRCQVALVTLPEETPVSETIETAFALEDEVGIKLAPLVVNGVWPEIEGLAAAAGRLAGEEPPEGTVRGRALAAARYRLARLDDQRAELDRLARELPLPQVELPFLFTTDLECDGLLPLADALVGGPAGWPPADPDRGPAGGPPADRRRRRPT
jgi:anion-transporting  ArsA/GET3 family ATPase